MDAQKHTKPLHECSTCCKQFLAEVAPDGNRVVCPYCGAHQLPYGFDDGLLVRVVE